jgi:acetolactate synthase-1/2/3 large subunit
VHDVREVVPPDGILTLDNGMYKIWFARNYRTRVANTSPHTAMTRRSG